MTADDYGGFPRQQRRGHCVELYCNLLVMSYWWIAQQQHLSILAHAHVDVFLTESEDFSVRWLI